MITKVCRSHFSIVDINSFQEDPLVYLIIYIPCIPADHTLNLSALLPLPVQGIQPVVFLIHVPEHHPVQTRLKSSPLQ